MRYVGSVSAEGGPLLLIGSEAAPSWRGVEGADYDRTCALFDAGELKEGSAIDVGGHQALLWELEGAGTAHVFAAVRGWTVVRAWLNEAVPDEQGALKSLASLPSSHPRVLGRLDLSGQSILLAWATENISAIGALPQSPGEVRSRALAVGGSALYLGKGQGTYDVLHDTCGTEAGSCRRMIVTAAP